MYNVLVADDHAIVRSGISYLVDLQSNFTVVDGTASGTIHISVLNKAELTF